MLPPLAEVEDVQERAGETYDATDRVRVGALLSDASSLIRSEAGQSWVDDSGVPNPPDVIFGLVLKITKRALDNPEGLTGETHPEYSWRRDGAEDGVYLTDKECRLVRRAGGKTGLWTQATTRLDTETDTVWVEDNFGSEPFPMYAIEDLA